jgi:hypothetical protein
VTELELELSIRKAKLAPIERCEGLQIGASLEGVVGIGDWDWAVFVLDLPRPNPTKSAPPHPTKKTAGNARMTDGI